MTRTEREKWDERYRSGEFEPPEEPSRLLRTWIDEVPSGRALDVATGHGRNAMLLAREREVDAVDVSGEALAEARRQADESGVDVNWVQADLKSFEVPPETYSLIHVSFYHDLNLLTDLKEGLVEDGLLVYEHHLRSSEPVEVGPPLDRYRFGSNELLRSCLDLTVLHYGERTYMKGERKGCLATLVARRSYGAAQTYPEVGERPY